MRDGSTVVESIELPCGSTAHFDHASGCAYRCDTCMAVVGSVGMPKRCGELIEEERARIAKGTRK